MHEGFIAEHRHDVNKVESLTKEKSRYYLSMCYHHGSTKDHICYHKRVSKVVALWFYKQANGLHFNWK